MRMLKLFLYLFSVALLGSCAKEVDFPLPKPYPTIKTISVTPFANGATAKGEVLSVGVNPITEYGFIYYDVNTYAKKHIKKKVGTTAQPGVFEASLSVEIVKDEKYLVQAYIISNGTTVYGNKIYFNGEGSAEPVISNFSPQKGLDGTLITIRGKNFSYNKSLIKVKIGDIFVEPISFSTDSIVIRSPTVKFIGHFPITVTIQDKEAVSTEHYSILGPSITHLSVNKGCAGDEITIYGEYLGTSKWGIDAYFGNRRTEIISVTPNEIKVIVPGGTVGDRLVYILGYYKNVSRLPFTLESRFKAASVVPASMGELRPPIPSFTIDDQAHFFSFDGLISYNVTTSTWENKGKFPGPSRHKTLIHQIGNKVFLMGGRNTNTFYGDVWEYSHQTNNWIKKADLPFKFFDVASFVLNDKIYFFGGTNTSNNKTLWQYDPVAETTVALKSVPNDTYYVSAIENNGVAYAFIGNKIYIYDEHQDNWLERGKIPTGNSWIRTYAFIFKNEIYTINSTSYNTSGIEDVFLYKYNETTNTFSKVANYYDCVNSDAFTGFKYGDKLYIGSFGPCSSTLFSYQK